jgi:hypothetical protein
VHEAALADARCDVGTHDVKKTFQILALILQRVQPQVDPAT